MKLFSSFKSVQNSEIVDSFVILTTYEKKYNTSFFFDIQSLNDHLFNFIRGQ
jgi:hypothetical protein